MNDLFGSTFFAAPSAPQSVPPSTQRIGAASAGIQIATFLTELAVRGVMVAEGVNGLTSVVGQRRRLKKLYERTNATNPETRMVARMQAHNLIGTSLVVGSDDQPFRDYMRSKLPAGSGEDGATLEQLFASRAVEANRLVAEKVAGALAYRKFLKVMRLQAARTGQITSSEYAAMMPAAVQMNEADFVSTFGSPPAAVIENLRSTLAALQELGGLPSLDLQPNKTEEPAEQAAEAAEEGSG